ncbi:MAG: hypothetical protein J6A15_03365 [Clostridia bacterium]|nr:hypothetical protein [Clostridia bacterium]
MLPSIKFERKNGKENFENINKQITLLDFWTWAYSDLMDNTQRGKLAEYIVAIAIDKENTINDSFSKYDLTTETGIKIEVKASAYLQSWKQKNYSNIVFNIPETYGWNSEDNVYESEKKRQSDIYVFCLLNHKDKQTVNPLDIKQWEFYILKTSIINEKCCKSKTISLSKLEKLGAIKCVHKDILKVINQLT